MARLMKMRMEARVDNDIAHWSLFVAISFYPLIATARV